MSTAMKTMLRKHLESKGCFTDNLPDILHKATACISTNASDRMKLLMSATELVVFVSQLRKPIVLMDGTSLPINIISIILSGSGTAKDSSMNQVRKALKPAYSQIEEYRIKFATQQAKRKAVREGKEEKHWMQYYSQPRDIFSGLSTNEGQINHMAKLEEGELGAAYTQVSELGSELQSNKNIADIIVSMAVAYDLGSVPSKIIKSDENQTPSIKALPYSGLLFGSQANILFDETIKNKFKIEFTTKLSRRCFFNFNTDIPMNVEYASIAELATKKRAIKQSSTAAQKSLAPDMLDLVETTTRDPLTVSNEAEELYDAYLEYNDLESQDIGNIYPIAQLARKHLQWRVLKLSGAFAVLRGSEVLEEIDYIQAINFAEMFSTDLLVFEKELSKEVYEVFTQYIRSISQDGKAEISAHTMKKMGYLQGSGAIKAKIAQLVHMATSSDKTGIYTINDDKVIYEEIKKTNVSGASFLNVTGTKQEKQYQCAKGYAYQEVKFPALAGLLSNDVAFTPFEFEGGIRGRDNIIGGFSWVVLDIDEGVISDEDLHYIIDDINHHISRTSNPDVPNKFRVVLQLDAYVTLNNGKEWKYFIESIADSIGIKADALPQSSIYFGYSGRNVLSTTDKKPIEVKEHLLYAAAKVNELKPEKVLTTKEKSAKLATPFSTFSFAFECPNDGSGSRRLYSAMHKAASLGMNTEEIEELVRSISDYWDYPMEEARLKTTLISQIPKLVAQEN